MFVIQGMQFFVYSIIIAIHHKRFLEFKDSHGEIFWITTVGYVLIAIEMVYNGILYYLKKDSTLISLIVSVYQLLTVVYMIWAVILTSSDEM